MLPEPIEIAQLEERRQAVGVAEIARSYRAIGSGTVTYGGPGSWANMAAGLGLDGPVDDAELDSMMDFFATHDAQPTIEVCPFADDSLLAGLAQRGFGLVGFENVLVRNLSPDIDWDRLHPMGMPPELTIVRVDPKDTEQTERFIQASNLGFYDPEAPLPAVVYEVLERMVRHPRCVSFTLEVDGEAIGGGAMEVGDDIGCLFGTSIAAKARRRGYQQALFVERMRVAAQMGCQLMCVHSAPTIASDRNARRLGFSLAYTKVELAVQRRKRVT